MFYTKFRTDTCGVRLRNENTEIHTVFGIVSPSLAKQFQRDAHLDKHGAKTRLPDLVRCSPEGRRPNRQREREREIILLELWVIARDVILLSSLFAPRGWWTRAHTSLPPSLSPSPAFFRRET